MSMDVGWGLLPTACSNWMQIMQTNYKLHIIDNGFNSIDADFEKRNTETAAEN